nr:hypothetical protein pmam_104 [Pithovirus mammoth]
MDQPNEILFSILLESNIDELPKVCNSTPQFGAVCSDPYFWKSKFQRDGVQIITPQDSVRGWVSEYINSKRSLEKAQGLFLQLVNGTLVEEGNINAIYADLESVNSDIIFPDFVNKEKLREFLAFSRISTRGGQILVELLEGKFRLIFETFFLEDKGDQYFQELDQDQAFGLVFLFIYFRFKIHTSTGPIH